MAAGYRGQMYKLITIDLFYVEGVLFKIQLIF